MTPKLFRAAEVCDIAQVQPYVLRSWEKEFPGIGVQKSTTARGSTGRPTSIRCCSSSGWSSARGSRSPARGASWKTTAPRTPAEADQEVAEVLDALASDARTRIAYVRDGLRSILQLLSNAPGTVVVVDDDRANGRPTGPAAARRRCA